MRRRVARLSEAVRERRAVELLYGGAWRVVHPHALGRTGTGRTGLLTWRSSRTARRISRSKSSTSRPPTAARPSAAGSWIG